MRVICWNHRVKIEMSCRLCSLPGKIEDACTLKSLISLRFFVWTTNLVFSRSTRRYSNSYCAQRPDKKNKTGNKLGLDAQQAQQTFDRSPQRLRLQPYLNSPFSLPCLSNVNLISLVASKPPTPSGPLKHNQPLPRHKQFANTSSNLPP